MKVRTQQILTIAAVALTIVWTSLPTNADTIIFDDTYAAGWADPWNVSVDADYAHDDSAASLRRIGNGVFVKTTDSAGLTISQTPIFEAYVNFAVSEDNPGHSITSLRVSTVDGDLFEFDNRSAGWTCYLDGVEYVDAAEIVFDTDPQTWQHFMVDMSQVDYFGWPYQSRQLGDTAITSIALDTYRNTTGSVDMLVDDIRLTGANVPEPATLALLGLGGLAVRRRWRSR